MTGSGRSSRREKDPREWLVDNKRWPQEENPSFCCATAPPDSGPKQSFGMGRIRTQGPYPYGIPEVVASGKGRLFPSEGGPAILEIEVPESIVRKADMKGEVRFEAGFGLEELLDVWSALPKRIVVP